MQTVWLRPCYDEDPNEKYKVMRAEAEVTCDRYLDDNTRYAFDDGSPDCWRQVLVRVPGITDFMGIDSDRDALQYRSGQNEDELRAQREELEDEGYRTLALKQLEFQAVIYLLNREAIKTGLVKMLWLDEHDYSAWKNRVAPSCLGALAGAFLSCIQLDEITGGTSGRGSMITR
ncbi:hypothetical protein PENCOP_c007G03819 [Penicillium coprophilum]|uniref:Uncharacterized protein n=1 Tax=Penicillium coprophilum TaxID=36646 RepID=A0A1V6UKY1_9EURO|nr:hypothetical protein PENCOP_c007G03819 [Penicillium coprophilum]